MQKNHKMAHRQLPVTGDVWEACSSNITNMQQSVYQNSTDYTKTVYQYTIYDDEHEPQCTCFWDRQEEVYWMQCSVGDKDCNENNSICSGTHEYFLFSDTTGNLKQKSACNVCSDVSICEGIQEICTMVLFHEEDRRPERCYLREMYGNTLCHDCEVCFDKNGNHGIRHDCFNDPTPVGTCDTSGTAHLHNFQPVFSRGSKRLGGAFAQVCENTEILYEVTDYDDVYPNKQCDCKDPTEGIVMCDLFDRADDCFATQCAELSEIFYFDANGEMNEKMSCDMTNDTQPYQSCSLVQFSDTGTPTTCSIVVNGTTCTNCQICEDSDEFGIKYDCFGIQQRECLSTKGRALHNLKPNTNNSLLWIWILCALAASGGLAVVIRKRTRSEIVVEDGGEGGGTTDAGDPPSVLVNEVGEPKVDDPTPIALT